MRDRCFLSASAAYVLTHNFPQRPRVHELTRCLESGLKELGVKITSGAETCMVFFNPMPLGISYQELVTRVSELFAPTKLGGSRLVVHKYSDIAAGRGGPYRSRSRAGRREGQGWFCSLFGVYLLCGPKHFRPLGLGGEESLITFGLW
ncbi:hypothetical protein BC835DRAFT_1360834 [Cytidiella melzeri]|nr:hypothetical protein BC835DRAFT_1360834 [Cytidiella melzeri]